VTLAQPTAPPAGSGFHALRVAGVERLCDDAVAVTFAVPGELAERYAFRPGQSVTLRRSVEGRDERRSYSICAPAGGPLRIGVREVADGLFSRWLVHEVRPGDEVEVLPPSGTFTPGAAQGHQVLIAAGSGITPVLSIAATLLREGGSVTLIYGNRRSGTVMFADELADLKDRYPARFELVHVLSREPREVELLSGRLDPAKLRILLPALVAVPEVAHWWLCGPYEMVTGARAVLTDLGVGPERIHRELFYVEAAPPPLARHEEAVADGPACSAEITLDGRTSKVELPRDMPILDAAQRWRPDLPFACKGGVCGTCRAQVLAGEVDMRRNFALEEHELAKGFVLTCQSYPVTEELRLTYDA